MNYLNRAIEAKEQIVEFGSIVQIQDKVKTILSETYAAGLSIETVKIPESLIDKTTQVFILPYDAENIATNNRVVKGDQRYKIIHVTKVQPAEQIIMYKVYCSE